MSSAFDYPNQQTRQLAQRALVRMTADESLVHIADFYRTNVTPGADPRVQWARTQGARYRLELGSQVLGERKGDARYIVEIWPDDEAPIFNTLRRNTRIQQQESCHYVPVDVCRWRDPRHRAALTQRAREYAAFQPKGKR